MLEVKELYFRHKGEKRDILKGINFLANEGEITTILGPNGSGKSTLFKCISGLWKHYKGKIKVKGIDTDNLSINERAKFFSIVPQEHEPPFPYTVFEVVLMGRANYISIFSSPTKKDYEKANLACEAVGISHLKDIPYTQISGGERQLTLIARALAQEAPIMLLDEPTSHLDFKNQLKILKKIKEITKEKRLVTLISLHDPNLASLFSDKLILIKNGSIVCNGHPKEVINEKILKDVYGVEVDIFNKNGFNLVFPKIEK